MTILSTVATVMFATTSIAYALTPLSLNGPDRVAVGQTVSYSATGLLEGRYTLRLRRRVTKKGTGYACYGTLARGFPGDGRLRGRVPARARCVAVRGAERRYSAGIERGSRWTMEVCQPTARLRCLPSASRVRQAVKIKE